MHTEINLLIVDDDAGARETLSDILSEENYIITGAGNISDAKSSLKDKFYNIVLVDIRLPDGSGLDLLKYIKRLNEEIMVVVFTGYASFESAISAMNEGAFAYIQKPLNIEEVKVTIKKALKMQMLSLHNKKLIKDLQEKMREIESLYKVKSEFTQKVSHELRTPLAAMKESIDLIFDGSVGKINQEQKEFLSIAKKNADRLSRLINDVLDFSKLSSHKAKIKIEPVNLNELIESVVNINKLVIEKQGLSVKMDLASTKDLVLNLDADSINQVLTNLINNAVKFTEKGVIKILTEFEKDAESVKVCVEDEGIGILQEDIPKLFQPFVQVGPGSGKSKGGTGLGLAICKEIIEQAGGKIWVESEFKKGSKFYFSLPVKEKGKL